MSAELPASPDPARPNGSPVFDAYFVRQLFNWFSGHGTAWSGTPSELLKELAKTVGGRPLGLAWWPRDGSQLLAAVYRNSARITRSGILLSVIERPGSPRFISLSWANRVPPPGGAEGAQQRAAPAHSAGSQTALPNLAGSRSGLKDRARHLAIVFRRKLTLPQVLTFCLAVLAVILGGTLESMLPHSRRAQSYAPTTPVQSAAVPAPSSALVSAVSSSTFDAATAEAALQATLAGWLASWKQRDLEQQVAYYAPVLDTYFTQHNVPREKVRKDKEYSFWLYTRVHRYELSNLRIQWHSPREAVATFRKTWDFSGRKRFSGDEIEALTLVKTESGWRIKTERELKVFRRFRG
jgi:hypothetical protein